MDYEIIEEISRADIAFRVRGRDPVELFSAGAAAIMSIMLENPEIIRTETEVVFECEAPELDLLYHDFLSEFIYYKDSHRLLLIPGTIQIDSSPGKCRLLCRARGESINRERHIFKIDIKAITLHQLQLTHKHDSWEATAVVDV